MVNRYSRQSSLGPPIRQISRVEKRGDDQHGRASSRDVSLLWAVVRLGQDAVRGEHCGDGDCWRLSPGRREGEMQGALRGKIEPSSDAKHLSILL